LKASVGLSGSSILTCLPSGFAGTRGFTPSSQYRGLGAYQSLASGLDSGPPAVGVETVLSTDKYRPLVSLAKVHGFEIQLLHVVLRDVELNIQRVKTRAAKGGHDVPEDKIRERRGRSFQQLAWFLDQADRALIYDNSARSPLLIGSKQDGTIRLDPKAPPEILEAVRSLES
jgi:predicted ABC-type ATPase